MLNKEMKLDKDLLIISILLVVIIPLAISRLHQLNELQKQCNIEKGYICSDYEMHTYRPEKGEK